LNIYALSLTKDTKLKIATKFDAKVAIPWHSFRPDLESNALREIGLNTYIPQLEVPMIFEG
jgi:ribonuclease J